MFPEALGLFVGQAMVVGGFVVGGRVVSDGRVVVGEVPGEPGAVCCCPVGAWPGTAPEGLPAAVPFGAADFEPSLFDWICSSLEALSPSDALDALLGEFEDLELLVATPLPVSRLASAPVLPPAFTTISNDKVRPTMAIPPIMLRRSNPIPAHMHFPP